MTTTVVISGANRGIGLALCRLYIGRGNNVIALCRTPSDELSALGANIIPNADVTDNASLQAAASAIAGPIDILIHNAGILFVDELDGIDDAAIVEMQRQYDVNALGPLRLTLALRKRLHRGSRLAIITSAMGSIADNTSGGYYGYRMSKSAVNMLGKSLSVDLQDDGVAVGLIHPGYVRTDMTGGQGLIDTTASATGIGAVIDKLNAENSGSFWHSDGRALDW